VTQTRQASAQGNLRAGSAKLVALAVLLAALACRRDRAATLAATDAGEPTIGPQVPAAGGSPTAETPAPSAPAAAEPTEPPATPGSDGSLTATMKLLDAGSPPRRKLRYTWNARQGERLTMDLRTSETTESGGTKQPEMPLPPLRFVIAIDPRNVSPEGDLRFAWRVTSSTVTADSQTPPQVADGWRAEAATVDHLSGTATVTSRGLANNVSIDPESPTDAGGTGQMVEQVRQTLRDIAAPFPEEDVGRGARWEKLSQLSSQDAHITQTDTFTLLDLAGNKGTFADVQAQTGPPQTLRPPSGQHGPLARIESMLASGSGTVRFDLSRLVPQTTFDGITTMVVSSHSSEGGRRLTMTMRMGIVLAGSTR
jgi:hypothetical protein